MGLDSRILDGAPAIAFGTVPSKQIGRVDFAAGPSGRHYRVQYAVVEADSVETTNGSSGDLNPRYFSDDPGIVRAICGSVRIAAMKEAYDRGTAGRYRAELLEDQRHGVSPRIIASLVKPVLVRVIRPEDAEFILEAKADGPIGVLPLTEKLASQDAGRMNFADIETGKGGAPTVKGIMKFISSLPPEEQKGLLDDAGKPTRLAENRLKAAILAWAFRSSEITRLELTALDPLSFSMLAIIEEAASGMLKLDADLLFS